MYVYVHGVYINFEDTSELQYHPPLPPCKNVWDTTEVSGTGSLELNQIHIRLGRI